MQSKNSCKTTSNRWKVLNAEGETRKQNIEKKTTCLDNNFLFMKLLFCDLLPKSS